MSQLVPIGSPALQALVVAPGKCASMRFLEFSAANIHNPRGSGSSAHAIQCPCQWQGCAESGRSGYCEQADFLLSGRRPAAGSEKRLRRNLRPADVDTNQTTLALPSFPKASG